MINNKKINVSSNNRAKILVSVVIFICVFLSLWIIYSFYGFYQSWQKTPQNNGTDSYIDKSGLAVVKSMLEGR